MKPNKFKDLDEVGGVGYGKGGSVQNSVERRKVTGNCGFSEGEVGGINEKLGQLNPKIRQLLKECLCENERKGGFVRIYPTQGC